MNCILRHIDSRYFWVAFAVLASAYFFWHQANPPPPERPQFTLSQYEAVKEGMTYRQVEEVIGFPGEDLAWKREGDTLTELYMWSNPNMSNMHVTFENGKLVEKSQAGLK